MLVNCAVNTKVQPLSPGYYYVSGADNYILTPDLQKIPADDLANKIADHDSTRLNLRQRDQKVHLMCSGSNGHHIHTFVIGERVIERELLTLGCRYAMTPDGKVITLKGVCDIDSGKPIHEFVGYNTIMDNINWYQRPLIPNGHDIIYAHRPYYQELAARGYIVARKSDPLAYIVYDYIHNVETRFDGAIDIKMYADPIEFVITAADKFMIIRGEPAISKSMPPPKISAAIAGDAVHIVYNKSPFETYTCDIGIGDISGHPLARNLELLYEIVKDAIDREPHLSMHLAEKSGGVTVTIRFLQKYAPEPLVVELARVERDRVDVIGAKVDWLLNSLHNY
jgi:hypothetical protein